MKTEDKKKVFRIILSLIVFFCARFMLTELWAILLTICLPEINNEIKYFVFTLGNLTITVVAVLPLFCFCMRFPLKSIKTLFYKSSNKKVSLWNGIILGIIVTIPVALIETGLLLYGELKIEMIAIEKGVILLGKILQSIIIMPIVEEVVFRGILMQSLENYKNRTSIFISTLAFAAGHLNPVNLLIAIPAGIVLGSVRVKTGSIRLPVLIHIIVNICGMFLWPYLLTKIF